LFLGGETQSDDSSPQRRGALRRHAEKDWCGARAPARQGVEWLELSFYRGDSPMKTIHKSWGMQAVLAGCVLLLAGFALAQDAAEKTLIVNGRAVRGAIVESQGRTFVDIKMLSEATGATLSFDADRIRLVIPTASGGNPAQARPQSGGSAPPQAGYLSTNFRAATIAALSDMRQWQGAMESVVSSGMQVNGTWPQDYRDHAEASVNLARVHVMTDEDQSAMRLLENEFAALKDWADKVVAERKNLNAARFVDPNALKNDVALSKISDCSRFMGGMISSGAFADNASCH
jgi:hypothetical protein